MLEKEHINRYWEEVMRAKQRALNDILTARAFANEKSCQECQYCQYLLKHEQVLGKTAFDLIVLIDSLSEGAAPKRVAFPRKYNRGELFYCGLIAHDGSYLPAPKETYQEAFEEYSSKCGLEDAYRAIYILGKDEKAEVIFCDRHAPPNEKQKETLRDLLIDAKGKLRFFFVYHSIHPDVASVEAPAH
jgi:hypothetical protein